ncbi:MAG: UDP-glucose 4-epimerase GalE [Leptolyngbya sp. PLA3]|nr:MAG: UDP-glucose 4-epimerase GalE [Cyanobacteria bacterium CYA]MCE7969923.1 UDP-glucose 4-epimerase GalE [Leptolyngbya sp. PL-A3]
MNILVTGGAGYIGSHAVQRLLRDGHTVVCVDNLFRGHAQAMHLLARPGQLVFERSDVGDGTRVERLMLDHAVDTILHFAALAYVGESVDQPLFYYENNVAAPLRLLEAADRAGVSRFIFSSSCATYGQPPDDQVPISESCPQKPVSPYGQTKLDFEHILLAWSVARARAEKPVAVAMLRYFNVAGADRSGVLGEDHQPETHLIPVAIQAALGKREGMAIFGTDYPTSDGTCIRDYVHVEDLIDAHVRVMEKIRPGDIRAYNVGIGKGYSVRQVLDSVRRVTGRNFQVREEPRRAGDPAALYNNPTLIARELGWHASVTDLDAIVDSAWQWMKRHPDGYATR